jgi:hypothetical protein
MDLSVYIVYVGFVKRVTCLKGIMNDESAIMCMMIGWNKYYYYYYYYIPSRMSSMTGHHHSIFSYIFLVRT